MASPLYTSLHQKIDDLKTCFIIERDDISEYDADDHRKAVAFVLLASAELEAYVEERCKKAANESFDRLVKNQPTIAGRALVMWAVIRKSSDPHPFDLADVQLLRDRFSDIRKAYVASAAKSHGIDDKDFKSLAYPLGFRPGDIPEQLFDLLKELSQDRNPAAHGPVNRAKSLMEPKQEWTRFEKILKLLEVFDKRVDELVKG
ncbi:HEPN domain-containing protein [Paenarthrobacter nitroguajacolicus]|uniref:HEPN domain-containing protein n=1 Tax=Paenarthrobacter nitroguajacolicus TaxID=211146 RepID=UPI00248D1048|nr:hypothetical protein [Paenarthrobacter nitroguajacolicus]MDI2036780.1 hypothetical protein [Paenarthrobacter nitroguajacolicus]